MASAVSDECSLFIGISFGSSSNLLLIPFLVIFVTSYPKLVSFSSTFPYLPSWLGAAWTFLLFLQGSSGSTWGPFVGRFPCSVGWNWVTHIYFFGRLSRIPPLHLSCSVYHLLTISPVRVWRDASMFIMSRWKRMWSLPSATSQPL